MMPVECDVRLFDELDRLLDGPELLVPRAVVDELDDLSTGTGTAANAASVGYDLAVDRCTIRSTEAGYADDAVYELAAEATHVVTNDGPLADRLLQAGVSVISLRGKNKLNVTRS